MLKVLNFCQEKEELSLIHEGLQKAVAYQGDDDLSVVSVQQLDQYEKAYLENDSLDISYFDITADSGAKTIERLRKENDEVKLVIVADTSISPLVYLKPSIMACSLLLRPITEEGVEQCNHDLIFSFYNAAEKKNGDKKFCVETKDGRAYYRYDDIVYFEARNKKIFLNTKYSDVGFYSTLDEIEELLPENFIRCHRSFIVNTDKIMQVIPSQNSIICSADLFVPLSRSYKQNVMNAMEKFHYE